MHANDGAAIELVGGVRAAHVAAHEHLEHERTRLRSTLKTKKSTLTRQRIMDAASKLIIERHSVLFQMIEVADACGMSKGSLYYYFRDRDELIAAVFDESVNELVTQMENAVAQAKTARDALHGLYEAAAQRLRQGSVLSLAMTHELAGAGEGNGEDMTLRLSRVAEVIAAQLERAKAEGIVRADIDSTAAAVFVTGGFIATAILVAQQRQEDAEPLDTDALVAHLMGMTLQGVGTEDASLMLP